MTDDGLDALSRLAPLTPPSTDDLVYRSLRREIVRGLPPGTPLPLRELAERFGVSTTPVRVALQRLTLEGLCVDPPRRGAYVSPLNIHDLEDIQTVRAGLEAEAVRLGVTNLQDHQIQQLRTDWDATVQQWKGLAETNADSVLDSYVAGTAEIRSRCYAATRLPKLVALIAHHQTLAERYLRVALSEIGDLQGDIDRHESFVTACETRDLDAAESFVRSSLRWTLDAVRPFLQGTEDTA